MSVGDRRRPGRPWLLAWWSPRQAEALLIALLIQGLTAVTLIVGYHAYQAGLAALSGTGRPIAWLFWPGEAGLVLVLGLAAGSWLSGIWLGEYLRRRWLGAGLLIAIIGTLGALQLQALLSIPTPGERLVIAGLVPLVLLLGGLAGAWWAGLGPTGGDD